ncbi:PPP4R2-domain-containing protein [Mucor lusitanicus]|uniref:Uncharacterized protein n=2 Tax=Mucor circinelloides f. lusitanicus TaxID=29924 RepID=A0A168HXW5_MUCCL|nr:PPP4R2-domain-containing protein [Mucor lusitanicus]OAC99320.1 hypothetical protein MUCCIDRAFT_114505 [Mucor lusitanicus CBS 277.49]
MSEITNGDESLSSTTLDLDDTVEVKKVNRPDLVEINDAFDDLEIKPVLKSIAETNELAITWQELQKILDALINKQHEIMKDNIKDENARKDADDLATKISHSINDHTNCPFTIQRLCELVIEPKKYYKMYVKYLRAVEKVLLVTSYWEDYDHSNDKDTTMEETSGSEKLLPSFNNCIELEPHNFTTSEPIEEDEVNAEEKAQDLVDKAQEEHDEEVVTDRIDPETKDEIKKTLKREPVQVEGGTEKKVKNEDGNDKQEGDVDMKKENIIEEEAVIEKVEFSTAPNTPAATEGASNEESKMDLD